MDDSAQRKSSAYFNEKTNYKEVDSYLVIAYSLQNVKGLYTSHL